MSGASTAHERTGFTTDTSLGDLIVVAGVTAVLFAGGLAMFEAVPEFGADIDLKPFFIVYAVILFVPWGTPTIAAAVGATIAEGMLDFVEGFEADDPFGWPGYLLGFTAAGWIFGNETDDYARLTVGAILGALVQFVIEGLVLFVVAGAGKSATLKYVGVTLSSAETIYAVAVAGNTITHGIIGGIVLLLPTVAYLEGRIERIFPLAAQSGRGTKTAD